jgi:DNA invertase Pin-like site-specific DNA recombinase
MELIGYIRVSTDKQAIQGHSLAGQEAALHEWASFNGHQVSRVIPDVMSSAKVDRLHGREAAIRLVETGLADGLLVLRYDRATRSTLDGAELLDRSRRKGWPILDTAGKSSMDEDHDLMTDVEIAFAAAERKRISRRTKEGLAQAKASGKVLGRRPMVTNAAELAIADLHAGGLSARAIAAELTERGIASPGGGARWCHSSVVRIVRRLNAEDEM